MDKKNKIFFAVFFMLIASVVIVTFIKYFVAKDYYIEGQADCDPYTQNCFIWECDPESNAEGEKCTGDEEKDIWYYQKVRKIANEIPLCDPNDENCNALSCVAGMNCEVTYCSEDTKGEDEVCNDLVKFTEENPTEEASEECAADDEECQGDESEDSGTDMDSESEEESGIYFENFVG